MLISIKISRNSVIFSGSDKLRMVFFMIINVKMPTFLSRTNFMLCLKAHNMELNDLRIIIRFRKSEVSVERISFCNIIENLAEHDIHCLPCSYNNDVINTLQ